mgnify:CR=1 FL=1
MRNKRSVWGLIGISKPISLHRVNVSTTVASIDAESAMAASTIVSSLAALILSQKRIAMTSQTFAENSDAI